MVAAIRQTTGCSCIPTVIGRSIANRSTWHHRVPHGAFERLERHAGKLARVVLRGLDGSNPVRLPGARRAGECVGVSGSLFNRVHTLNRVVGGPFTTALLQAPQSAYRIGCLRRAADTDRRSFEARRPHASRSQQHTACAEPQARGAQRRRTSVRSLPGKGMGSALERGECAAHRRRRQPQDE